MNLQHPSANDLACITPGAGKPALVLTDFQAPEDSRRHKLGRASHLMVFAETQPSDATQPACTHGCYGDGHRSGQLPG